MLTNKILADSMGVPLTRIRRWAKEYLPPDPKATRQSGYLREYSDNDGWFLFISGIIMDATGFTFRKTQKIMNEILKPWMFRVGLAPDIQDVPVVKGVDAYLQNNKYVLHFHINEQSVDKEIPPIRVEGMVDSNLHKIMVDERGKEFAFINEKKITYWVTEPLTKRSVTDYYRLETVAPIKISSLLGAFIYSIFGSRRLDKWIEDWYKIHLKSESKKPWDEDENIPSPEDEIDISLLE